MEVTRKRVRGELENEENEVVVDLTKPQERSVHDSAQAKSWGKAEATDIDAAVANLIYSESVATPSLIGKSRT